MRKITASLTLALLLVGVLGLTVYSQRSSGSPLGITVLDNTISQQIPVEITLLVPTESGVQTVTVPLSLRLDLSLGAAQGVTVSVAIPEPVQSLSPLDTGSTVTTTVPITETDAAGQ